MTLTMDFHNTSLDNYEFMQDLFDRGARLKEEEQRTVYYIEAFSGTRLQWMEWADTAEERDALMNDAQAAGFHYTVHPEIISPDN